MSGKLQSLQMRSEILSRCTYLIFFANSIDSKGHWDEACVWVDVRNGINFLQWLPANVPIQIKRRVSTMQTTLTMPTCWNVRLRHVNEVDTVHKSVGAEPDIKNCFGVLHKVLLQCATYVMLQWPTLCERNSVGNHWIEINGFHAKLLDPISAVQLGWRLENGCSQRRPYRNRTKTKTFIMILKIRSEAAWNFPIDSRKYAIKLLVFCPVLI